MLHFTETDDSFSFVKNDVVFTTQVSKSDSKSLVVVKEPEEDDKLRIVSDNVAISQILTLFAQEYLLPTMYEEGGIGIASIQVGLPIRLFIVDIPLVKSINGIQPIINDPRYVRKAVAEGKKVKVLETRPTFHHGSCTHLTIEKTYGNLDVEEFDSVEILRNPLFLLNPQITQLSDATIAIEEGCLSVPREYVLEKYGPNTSVCRPLGLTLTYETLLGEEGSMSVDGGTGDHDMWLARCIQHEYDHLNGVLFTDKISK
jgi:peptide deformylase